MAELPEVARRHLSCATAVADHPDAGLLTAFVEGTLTKTHREELLAHLVTCSKCNRLVALIAPEREVTGVVQVLEVRRRWFASTVGRWAGVAAVAAVLVCAVAVTRIYQPMKAPAARSAAALKAAPSGMSTQLPGLQPSTRYSSNETQRAGRQQESVPGSGEQRRSEHNAAIAAQNNPAIPGNALDNTAFQTSMMSHAGPSGESPAAGVEALKTKPVTSVSIPAASANASAPLWSISDTGVLQKSADGGHTWTAVEVPTHMPLRALAVLGQNIWTGGDQGAVYHSTNSGQIWAPVVLMSEGTPLSADIVRIAFRDLRRGMIVTRNGDIWTTSDGGANWSKK